MPELKHISGPILTRAADVVPTSIDVEARTVEVIASTGAMGTRRTWDGSYDEQLVVTPEAVKLDRLNTTGAVLDNHSAYGSVRESVIGAVVPGSAKVDGGQLRATLRFAKTPAGDQVFGMVQDRILRAVSVGYDPSYEEIRAKDREDGGTLPLLRATSWEPYEISIVPMGFDPGAVVRSGEASRQTRTYAVRSRMEDQMPEPVAAPQTPAAPAVDEITIRRQAAKDAMTRSAEIREAGARVGLDARAIDEVFNDLDLSDPEIVVRAKAKIHDIRANQQQPPVAPRPEPTGPHVQMLRAGEDKTVEMIGLALMHRTLDQADPNKVRAFNERLTAAGKASEIPAQLTDDDGRRMRRARLVDVAEAFLRARGVNTAAMAPGHIAETALAYRSAGSMMTTADFAGLLANTANKMLSIGYSEVTSPWRECGIARRVDRPDFKTFTMYRRAGAPGLARINESGAVKRSGWADGTSFTAALQTAGVEVAFTRQMLINDDLEAFAQQNLGLGDSAVRWEDDEIITTLLYGNPTLSDGTAMFDSSRGNLSTDVGAPDFASIVNAAHMFGAMTETVKDPAANNGTKTRKIQFSLMGFLSALTEKWTIDQILQPRNPAAATDKLPSDLGGLKTWRDDRLQVETSAPDVHFAISNRTAIVYGGLTGDASPRLSTQVVAGVDGVLFQLIHDWYYGVEDPKAIIRIPKS